MQSGTPSSEIRILSPPKHGTRIEDANSCCNKAASSGSSHLTPGLLQQPSDRNSNMPRAVRLIFRSSGYQSVTVLMKDLDWLPVTSCVLFKVLVLVYKCRNGLGPGYLTSMLSAYTPVRGLRSASYGLLVEPQSRLKTVGDRAFSEAGPREWNRLPGEIRDCQTLGAFKRKLKTHLFRAAYGL